MQIDRNQILPTFPSGTFTLTSKATGAHRVLKIKRARWVDGLDKLRAVFVKGGNSVSGWPACAFVGGRELRSFRKFRKGSETRANGGPALASDPEYVKILCVLASLILDGPGGYYGSRGYSLLWEGRCLRCDRQLVDPESIARGIGPVCLMRTPLLSSESLASFNRDGVAVQHLPTLKHGV